VTVGGVIYVVAVACSLLLFLRSFGAKVQTLFSHRPPERVDDSAPSPSWLNFVCGVFIVAVGTHLARTGETSMWGAPLYGTSVRAAGVMMILIGITGAYDGVVFMCRRVFRGD